MYEDIRAAFIQSWWLFVTIILLGLSPAARAEGRFWLVTNGGVDSSTCGSAAAPCRSLSQAIENANDGDQLLVEAGRYGDLNGDGDFADPGDEHPDFYARCMICVRKSVNIVSRRGARATFLDASSSTRLSAVAINIAAFGVGPPKRAMLKGFTVMRALEDGIQVGEGPVQILDNIAIENISDGDLAFLPSAGFGLRSTRRQLVTVRGNIAIGNQVGFRLETAGLGVLVATENLAIKNELEGFDILMGDPVESLSVTNSDAIENNVGFHINGHAAKIQFDRATSNASHGFVINGDLHRLSSLSATMNKGAGIYFDPNAGALVVTKSNIYGNQGQAANGERNCGVNNASQNPVVIQVAAYFGAPTGQGPDPADTAGAGTGCDLRPESKTVVTSYSTPRSPFPP